MIAPKHTAQKMGIVIAAVLLAGTLAAGSLIGQAATAASLEPTATTALQQAGITGVSVTFQGREAYLSGGDSSSLDQAQQVVGAIRGVRWVKTACVLDPCPVEPASPTPTETDTTTPPIPPLPAQSTVSIVTGPDGVTVTGTVSSQSAADALATQIGQVFGQPVDNQLTIDSSCDPHLAGDLTNMLAASPAITGGSLTTDGASITIGGTVASDADLAIIDDALQQMNLSVTDNITVTTTPALSAADIAKINSTVIRFGDASYVLDAKAKRKLDAIIPLLAKSTATITINGYVSAPHQPGRETTDSRQRAQSVADYLIANGIDAARIHVHGRGTADPVASNDTTAGRAANRRATLTIS